MTMFQYINSNIDHLRYEMKIGIVPCALLKHWQIYCRYDYYRKAGNMVGCSVEYCCDDFNVSANWVFKIIRKMETEI